jgi:hypothetical protein
MSDAVSAPKALPLLLVALIAGAAVMALGAYGDPNTIRPLKEVVEEFGILLAVAVIAFGIARLVAGKNAAPVVAAVLGLVAVAGGIVAFWAGAGLAVGAAAIWLGRTAKAGGALATVGTVLGAVGFIANLVVPLGEHFHI